MAMKRKFEADHTDAVPRNVKQLRLPFPTSDDNDTVMTDAEPLLSFHTRISSNASASSGSAPESPDASYPSFELYPLNSPSSSPIQNVGLLQPDSSFVHHGTHCNQIPKLRMACSAGVNGQRTMWSHCEQCGAISMVDTE